MRRRSLANGALAPYALAPLGSRVPVSFHLPHHLFVGVGVLLSQRVLIH
jgi:hypothetical protein